MVFPLPGDYPYSMHFFAEAIADFIQQKQLGQVYLAGHSMGGQILSYLRTLAS